MVVFLYIAVLLQIFAHAVTGKSKSVNLALETVLEFDKYNLDSDVKIIDNVQKFLSNVRNVLHANTNNSGRRMSTPYLQFTDFLYSCIETLKTYDDENLQKFAESFDEEIRKYHYKGCKFYELLENNDARQYISRKFEEFRNHPPKKLRKVLNKIQKKLQNTKSQKVKAIINLINSLYRLDSQSKFQTFIDNLETYKTKRKNAISIDLNKIIKNGIRALIFDHYTNLNPNVRQDVKFQVSSFINTDEKPIERNDITTPTWNSHHKQPTTENEKNSERIGSERHTYNEKREDDIEKHKHSKRLHQEREHDIEADVTNKWLLEEVTTVKYIKKKKHRRDKHDNLKSDKKHRKHKKHKKKKAKLRKKKEAVTTKPINLLLRMTPSVQESRLPEKKKTTKSKIIMRVREDKPLSEILSETAAEVFVGGDTTLQNGRPPPIVNKDLQDTKDVIGKFRASKSSELSHSEQDKKDGLSIETWRRKKVLRRINQPKNNKADKEQVRQETTEIRTTFAETTLDPIVLKKIHNLEKELLHVKKKMRKQKAEDTSISRSSESESDCSEEQKTIGTTKSSKPTIFSSATPVTYPSTSTTAVSTTTNEKTTTMTDSSSESSTETEEEQDSTNATTIKITISEVELKNLTTEKKPLSRPTTTFKTTEVDPLINTKLIDSVLEKKEDNLIQFRASDETKSVRAKGRVDNSRDSKRNLSKTPATITEMTQGVVTSKNDIYELQFNVLIKSTTPAPEPVDIVFRNRNNDTSSKVKNTTKHSKHMTDIPNIVDVISVLNSTMSMQNKLKRLQSLRRKVDLMSDDDFNAIS